MSETSPRDENATTRAHRASPALGQPPRPVWLRLAMALLSVATACAVRFSLTPFIGPTELPFIFFFLAVVVATGFGGLRAGLLAIALSAWAAEWFFFQPRQSLSFASWVASQLTFIIVSTLIVFVIEKIHRERQLLATTLRSIGDAVIATDAKGRVTFLNPEAEHLTGWKMSEARGKPLPFVFNIIEEYTRRPGDNPSEKSLQLGRVTGLANHTILVARDGSEIPISDSAAPIPDISGKIVGTVLVFRDITQERLAERAGTRLASIIENSDDAIIGKDLNGIVTSWNHAAERIFGYSPSEMIGNSIRTIIPEDRQAEEDRILATLRRGERVEHLETVRKTKDGREIQISLSSAPIRDAEGQIVGASKIARDITHRRAMQTELACVHADLENYARRLETIVAERTAHLHETIAELESVSYSLSHDLRAPLRAIQGFSEILLSDAGHKLSPDEAGLLHKSINAAKRLDRLIQDVLSYSKVVREKIRLSSIDVDRLVRQIIDERPDLQPPKARIEIQSPLPPVCGHEAYLSQCITNLLDNAVKFVAPDQQPRIRIRSENENGHVRLWFEDNGIGIPKQAQERVFGLFQRVHNESQYPGTGVGLSIVRKAVERMGGSAGVESEPGKGSRFWLELKSEPKC